MIGGVGWFAPKKDLYIFIYLWVQDQFYKERQYNTINPQMCAYNGENHDFNRILS